MMQTTCRGCGGSGENISNPCLSCNSQGVVRERRSVSLNIPAGVDNGLRLRLSGRGDSGTFELLMPYFFFEIYSLLFF